MLDHNGVSNVPLRVTPEAMREIVQHCREAYPEEAVGYVVADQSNTALGVRIRPMRNVAVDPQSAADMDPKEVLAVHEAWDAGGFEPIAAYHSHTFSPPKMSERDMHGATDPSLAYLIVSLEDPEAPKARAYRVRSQFIGVPTAREVRLSIGDGAEKIPIPDVPWALSPGNQVRLGYTRSNHTVEVHVEILAANASALTLKRLSGNSERVPTGLSITRIRKVTVLHEGHEARRLRQRMHAAARTLTAVIGSQEVDLASNWTAALVAAFPPGLTVVIPD